MTKVNEYVHPSFSCCILKNSFSHFTIEFESSFFLIRKLGEYFVLGVDLDRYDADNPSKYLRGLLKDDLDRKAIEAFENYVGVVGSPSGADFDNFTQMVNDYLERPPFNFPNPLTYFGGVKRVKDYYGCYGYRRGSQR